MDDIIFSYSLNIKRNACILIFIFEKLHLYFTVNNIKRKKTGKIMLVENRFLIKFY